MLEKTLEVRWLRRIIFGFKVPEKFIPTQHGYFHALKNPLDCIITHVYYTHAASAFTS